MTASTKKTEVESALHFMGPTFSGGTDTRCSELAEEWLDDFDDPDDARAWMEAGFWNPCTAGRVRDLGIAPEDVAALCADNITGHDDPVYAMCNHDLSPPALIG